MVVERSVTATFFFLQDIYRCFEAAVGLNDSGVADYHTTLDILLVDTAEEQTNVVAGFTPDRGACGTFQHRLQPTSCLRRDP